MDHDLGIIGGDAAQAAGRASEDRKADAGARAPRQPASGVPVAYALDMDHCPECHGCPDDYAADYGVAHCQVCLGVGLIEAQPDDDDSLGFDDEYAEHRTYRAIGGRFAG